MVYFVVYAADNASFIVLRDLLVNGEVKETMEALGLGIGNRDICERECHPLPDGMRIMSGDEGDRPRLYSIPGWCTFFPLLHLAVGLEAWRLNYRHWGQ